MGSADWIEHFYRNACDRNLEFFIGSLPPEDVRSLRAVRPGQLTARSGKLLVESAQQAAKTMRDGCFVWAVRLYVREQERQQRLIEDLLSAHGRPVGLPSWYSAWSAPVLDALPSEAILLLLSCRARVAASYFSALARKAASPQMRTLSEKLAAEQAAQLRFALFASAQLSNGDRGFPRSLTEPVRRTVTVAIATRVWLRQRRRLREAGQTFGGFVAGLLDPALS